MAFHARVLYTKHLTKKRKLWSDGYVKVNEQQLATLTAEDGAVLAAAKVAASEGWSSDTEGSLCCTNH